MKWQVPPTAATTKGGHFLPDRLFGENWRGKTGPARIWLGNFFTFVLPTTPGMKLEWLLSWHGNEFVHFGKNWWDRAQRVEIVSSVSSMFPRQGKIITLVSTMTARQEDLFTFFPRWGLAKTTVLKYPLATTNSCVSWSPRSSLLTTYRKWGPWLL